MARKVTYLKSAVKPVDYPLADRPEIAIAGRSNAGKSSFINAATRSKIANVSQTPGKTRILSFFDFGDKYRWVDMPGYGFAARSSDEIGDWQKMIESFFTLRGTLAGVILIMDVRRDWSEDEQNLQNFLTHVQVPMVVVLNKVDKITKSEQVKYQQKIQKLSSADHVFLTSAAKSLGVDEVEEFVFRKWIEPALEKGKKS